MMNEVFVLYLLTRIDEIKNLLGVSALVSIIILIAVNAFCWASADWDQFEREDAVKRRRAIRERLRYKIRFVPFAMVALCICAVITPSKNDILFIYGGSKLLEAVKSPRASVIGQKTVDLVEKWLDENVEGAK